MFIYADLLMDDAEDFEDPSEEEERNLFVSFWRMKLNAKICCCAYSACIWNGHNLLNQFIFLEVGDGGAGGGISLAGTWWDKEALTLAEQVSESFDGDLKIYAFKTSANSTIRVRIEKLSTK